MTFSRKKNTKIQIGAKVHYKDKFENLLQGTPDFMSIKVSEGFRPSARSDLESLIYTIIYLNKNDLPWSKIKAKSFNDKCKKICEMKKSIKIDDLFHDFPEEFKYIYKNVIKLDFDEKPDYNLYVILFKNILRKIFIHNNDSFQFCFVKKIKLKIEEEIKNDPNYNNGLNKYHLFKGFPIKYLIN